MRTLRIRCTRVVLLTAVAVALTLCCGRRAAAQQQQLADPFARTRVLLNRHVSQKHVAGAVALVSQRDRIVLQHVVGWQDVAARKSIRRDTMFRIASMTKPITSVAIMVLADDGKLSTDDPLSKFVPEFRNVSVVAPGSSESDAQPARREITIHDLLTHTSGITYRFLGQQPQATLMSQLRVCEGVYPTELTLKQNTQLIAKVPLVSQPGAMWNYGLSTDVLGRVVEAAAGMPFDTFVTTRVLKPLKMTDTHFVVPAEKRPRLASVYRPSPDNEKRIEPVGSGIVEAGGLLYSPDFPLPGKSNYRSGGAGLVSTADDYIRFLRMLLHRGELDGVRILKPATVDRMLSNQIGDLQIAFTVHGDQFGYGFGVHSANSQTKNGASPGTFSWGGVFHTYFWADPKRDIAGVLMTQLFPFDHLTLWQDFQKAAYEGLGSSVAVDLDDTPADPCLTDVR